MKNIRNKFYSFMYGRYGNDRLNNVLLWSYIVIVLLRMILFVFFDEPVLVAIIYYVLTLALFATIIFRAFSRNVIKRRRENERFFGFFKLLKNRFKDRKTHVYRKCPKCRAVLRLPKAKGKHTVVCPRCSERFSVRG